MNTFLVFRTIAHTLLSTPFLYIQCEMTSLFPFVLGFGMTNIPSQQDHLLLSNTFDQLISVDTNQFVKSRSVKSAKCLSYFNTRKHAGYFFLLFLSPSSIFFQN